MNSPKLFYALWLPAVMFILYMAATLFRPLLPIDETRYMSVAWEMFLRQGWLQPMTMNFEPYHHKPPLLFWLINASWSVLGISRWAGLLPLVLASFSAVCLTGVLGRLLFPDFIRNGQRVAIIMTASIPFLIYSTLVMFDMTLSVFVLLSLVFTVIYGRERRLRHTVLIGICLGLGVLTKGPVAYLYTLPPLLLAPFWMPGFQKPVSWYAGCVLALAVSFAPVLLWLIPVLKQANDDFAFWLVWNQTAGRITGNFNEAHNRPFYFYGPLLPVLLMPWIFFPAFWRGAREARKTLLNTMGAKFLACWLIPAFAAFCFISGKQPHYLVPLLPGIIILTALFLQRLHTKTLALTLACMVILAAGGQGVAAQALFKRYDLESFAVYMRAHPGHDWAYVRNYQGEMGFLARLKSPVANRQLNEVDAWFAEHSDGLALIRYKNPEDVANYKMLMSKPYRGKQLGIFSRK